MKSRPYKVPKADKKSHNRLGSLLCGIFATNLCPSRESNPGYLYLMLHCSESMNWSYLTTSLPSPDKGCIKSAIDKPLDGLAHEISRASSRELILMSEACNDWQVYHKNTLEKEQGSKLNSSLIGTLLYL